MDRKQPNASAAASSRYRKMQKIKDNNLLGTHINAHNHSHIDPSYEFAVDSENSDIMIALEKQQFVLLKGWFEPNTPNVALLHQKKIDGVHRGIKSNVVRFNMNQLMNEFINIVFYY